jgi:hypothetical protein
VDHTLGGASAPTSRARLGDMFSTRLILVATAALLAGAAGSAQAATSTLDQIPNKTAPIIAGGGGVAAWSHYDATANTWQLVASRDGGGAAPLPVATASKPFDVSIGHDANGALVAVYTRCTRGCDIYELDLQTGTETHLTGISSPTADEHDPSIFDGAIAFVRDERVDGHAGHTLRYAKTVDGPTKVLAKTNVDGIRSPALTDDRVAYIVDRAKGRVGFGEQDVHTRTLGRNVAKTVYKAVSGGANAAEVTNLTLDPGNRHAFLWARTNNGSNQGNRIVRYLATGSGSFTYAVGDNAFVGIASTGGPLGFVSVTQDLNYGNLMTVSALGAPAFDAKP